MATSPPLLVLTDRHASVLRYLPWPPITAPVYCPFGYQAGLQGGLRSGFNGRVAEVYRARYFLGNGYRCYDPALQRFYSPDSLSPFGEGGVNAYSYCAADPVNRLDDTGHRWFSMLTKPFRGLRKLFRRGAATRKVNTRDVLSSPLEVGNTASGVKPPPAAHASSSAAPRLNDSAQPRGEVVWREVADDRIVVSHRTGNTADNKPRARYKEKNGELRFIGWETPKETASRNLRTHAASAALRKKK
jgi:RHS repeat-associated protein